MTIMTSLVILRLYRTRTVAVLDLRQALKWRTSLLLLVVGFPSAFSIVYIVLAVKLHAIQGTSNMHCDATNPIWVRLFSFAGVPLLLAVPSLILTLTCAIILISYRKQRTHNLSRVSRVEPTSDIFTPLPSRHDLRPKRKSSQRDDSGDFGATMEMKTLPPITHSQQVSDIERRAPSTTPSPSSFVYAISTPNGSWSASTSLTPAGPAPVHSRMERYHLPFPWKSSSRLPSPENEQQQRDQPSPLSPSPSPILFASASNASSPRTSPINVPLFTSFGARAPPASHLVPYADERAALQYSRPTAEEEDIVECDTLDDAQSGSMKWARDSFESSLTKSDLRFAREASEDGAFDVYTRRSPPDNLVRTPIADQRLAFPPPSYDRCLSADSFWPPSAADVSPAPPSAHDSAAVWRILVFQLVLSFTQILATISSLVEITWGEDLSSSIGTQHVALLLVAWAPAIAFGAPPWTRVAR
ncbi:uncharacterized protein FIBRA_06928 [Fibroporia radiculosa]|uniref:Uncharacterized protein n=1 Tax=Fibroporia radiculosa TaxID=599839 RepID=J4H4C2_9APHY|nr:uncharacterized protein FIBRA_06928 [Fibroporia radiculosa]CCM04739.1 predicted protein [Fibroporia radiculosa]